MGRRTAQCRGVASQALSLLGLVATLGCPGPRGSVPMSGSRYPSTVCVLGLRGVRVAVDDSDTGDGSLDVTLSMGSDIDELKRRAHALVENADSAVAEAGILRPEPLRTPARIVVEDVANGIRIHVTPRSLLDLDALRSEINDRIERAWEASDCP
jgi:hypothetical protein